MNLTQSTKPRTAPRLATLVLITAVAVLTLNMFLPSLPTMAREFGTSGVVMNLAVSGYLAVTTLTLLIAGPLSDRLGRRPVLLGAIALFIAASVGCASATRVDLFLLCRLLQSGMAAGTVLSMAIIRDTMEQQKAAATIGYVGMSMALAPMLGPMFGGVLDAAFGWRANFWFYAMAGCLLWALCWRDVGETRALTHPDPKTPLSASLLRTPRFLAYALTTGLSRGGFYIFVTGAPFVAAAAFGAGPMEIGFYVGSITAGFLMGSFLTGRFAQRIEPHRLMLIGRAVGVGGLALGFVCLAAGVVTPVTVFGATVAVGLGNGLTIPSSNAASLSVNPTIAGRAAGYEGAMGVALGAVLTILTGAVLDVQATPELFLGLLLFSVLASTATVLWARRLQR